MSTGDDSLRTPMAPSSEPFYSNIPAAPISAGSPYPKAPPVRGGEFGETDEANPYSDMGYAAAQVQAQPVEPVQAPTPRAPSAAPTPQYSPTPVRPARADHSAAHHHPAVEDLYRAPGNPYADHSGRAAPASGHEAMSVPGFTPPRPRPVRPERPKRKGRSMFTVIVLLLVLGNLFVKGGSALWGYLEDAFSSSSSDLPTIADTDIDVGDCFLELDYVRGNHFQPVDCDDPHRFQVVLSTDAPFDDYPGEDELVTTTRETCQEITSEVSGEVGSTRLSHFSLYPSEAGWEAGDQTITCFVSTAGSTRLHGSYTDGTLEVY